MLDILVYQSESTVLSVPANGREKRREMDQLDSLMTTLTMSKSLWENHGLPFALSAAIEMKRKTPPLPLIVLENREV